VMSTNAATAPITFPCFVRSASRGRAGDAAPVGQHQLELAAQVLLSRDAAQAVNVSGGTGLTVWVMRTLA
jgi:hypothetical protein